MSKHAKQPNWMRYFERPEYLGRSLIYMGVFALLLPYYEMVFNLTTTNTLFTAEVKSASWIMILFSVAYSLVAFLIVSCIPNRRVNHTVSVVLMALLSLPYLVEFYIYKGFGQFYGFTTARDGATDMFNSYMSETLVVVFKHFYGLILFALPAVAFEIFGRCLYVRRKPLPANLWTRCLAVVMAVLCYSGGLLLINGAKDDSQKKAVIYNRYYISGTEGEHEVNHSIKTFGLLTGFGLDIRSSFSSKGDFSQIPSLDDVMPIVPTQPSQPTDVPQKPIEYGYNELELNLSGGSGDIAKLNEYVASLTASKQNAYTGLFKDKNLIMITAEAFSAEVIDPELTPTLYRLATKGVQFKDYYQPASAGTTGGEYQHIFGMLPTAGGSSFKKTADHYNYMTMGSQLDRLGYYGKAFHNNSYTYYSRDKTHVNLGYSDGYMGYGNGMEEYVQKRWPQSDLEMIQGTLPTYIDKDKFNIYYMTVSGHSNYTTTGNSMTARNWDLVKDLPYSDEVKGYLAANMELEKALTYLVDELEKKGIADDTVISITTDHFPYGLSDDALAELYGGKPDDYFKRDHSAWILWCGSLEKEEPIVVSTPTFGLDILPTLSNLFGTEFDSRLFPGRDVFSDAEVVVFNSNYDWKTEYGTYYASKGKFVPVDGVEVPDGYVDRMKTIVRNKIRYCTMALNNDYFRYLFEK